MAWNEPGNNGNNNDPWKNRGNKDQGPPDLDKIFQDLANKIGGLFGGKPRQGGGGSSNSKFGLGIIAALLVVAWVLSGFYTIKEAEKGVVLRFGKYYETKEAGLSWNPTFIDSVQLVNVKEIKSLSAGGDMLTKDENVVNVNFVVQYKIVDPVQYKFSVTDPDDSLSQATDSALRYVVGHSNMDDVLTSGREVVRQKTLEKMVEIIERYKLGLDVSDVNFKDARPPEEVKDAFDDAISAQEDEERFIKEAEAYARAIEPRARGQVKRMEQEASAYKQRVILEAQGQVSKFEKLLPQYHIAPEVTRQRMYLDTMEEVYSNTSKVLLDVDGGNNMMYLPLDKIMQNHGAIEPPTTIKNTVKSLQQQSNSTSGNSIKPTTDLRSQPNRSGRN